MWVSSLSGVKNLACDERYTEKKQGLTAGCRESTDNIPVRDVICGLPYGNSLSGASIRIDMNVGENCPIVDFYWRHSLQRGCGKHGLNSLRRISMLATSLKFIFLLYCRPGKPSG